MKKLKLIILFTGLLGNHNSMFANDFHMDPSHKIFKYIGALVVAVTIAKQTIRTIKKSQPQSDLPGSPNIRSQFPKAKL